jgi:tetratricopeptide (TPR) repeat protein
MKYIAFNSGKSLQFCDDEIGSFIASLCSCNPSFQGSTLFTLRPLNQLIRILMGKNTTYITSLTGDIISEEEAIRILEESKNQHLLLWLHYQISYLCYIFGYFQKASSEIKKSRPMLSLPFSSVELSFVVMLDGLIHLSPGKHRSLSTSKRRIRLLNKIAKKAPHHVLSCLNFLQAELAGIEGPYDRAVIKFTIAAALAKESNSLLHLGLIYEKFGDFYSRVGKLEDSRDCYRNAIKAFQDIGAAAKVDQISQHHPE